VSLLRRIRGSAAEHFTVLFDYGATVPQEAPVATCRMAAVTVLLESEQPAVLDLGQELFVTRNVSEHDLG
jgi:hypothetical protein